MWPSTNVNLFCVSWLSTALAIETLSNPLLLDSFTQPGNATYDYVVIGGGPAGSVMASRLATRYSVALVEAGGFYQVENGNTSFIPAFAPLLAAGSSPDLTLPLIDWGIVTTPQAGANGRRFHYPQGKNLGGSTGNNFMVYHRATIGAYQRWADAVGDQGYTFANLLPFFKKSSFLTPPNTSKRAKNGSVQYDPSAFDNSLNGPLQVSWPNYADPISTWALQGMAAVGIPLNPKNFNSGQLNGSAWVTGTINPSNSHRESSQTSYLNRAFANTTRLTVYTQTQAQRILFSANKTATGVVVLQNAARSLPFTLSARREVILSAGTFHSPQLLMLSGIGPASTLKRYSIPVISDLAGVGQNLQDQPLFGVSFRVKVPTGSIFLNSPSLAAAAVSSYRLDNSGPLTSLPTVIAWEELPSSLTKNFSASTLARLASFPPDWPDLEYIVSSEIIRDNTNYATADPGDGYDYATLIAVLAKPLSRGNVTVSGPGVADPPVVNPNWLTDPADVEVAVAGLRRLREIWGKMSGVTIGPEFYPGTKGTQTDGEIREYLKGNFGTIWHASGTCKMGKGGDGLAVVDPMGRVRGVNGLRVVDASVLPFLPPGHPQSTIYAVAERIVGAMLGAN